MWIISRETAYKAFVQAPLIVPFLAGVWFQISLAKGHDGKRRYVAASIVGLSLSVTAAVLLELSHLWPFEARNWIVQEALASSFAVNAAAGNRRALPLAISMCALLLAILLAGNGYPLDYILVGMASGGTLTAVAHEASRMVLRADTV